MEYIGYTVYSANRSISTYIQYKPVTQHIGVMEYIGYSVQTGQLVHLGLEVIDYTDFTDYKV